MARSKQLGFYAVGEDLLPILDSAESTQRIKYVRAGLLRCADEEVYLSGRELPHLGVTRSDHWGGECYLVLDVESDVHVRPVPQHAGGTLYGVDQMENPMSIVLEPGGLYNEACVISGRVGTIWQDAESLELYDCFARLIRRAFKRVDTHWLGPRAATMLRNGARLTPSVRASRQQDLKGPP